MAADPVSEAIARFLESKRPELLAALRTEVSAVLPDETCQVIQEWFDTQIEYLHGGSGRARAWIAMFLDRVHARGGHVGDILDRVRVARNFAIRFALGKIEGVSDADIYRVVLAAEDDYLKTLRQVYAELDRDTLMAQRRRIRAVAEAMDQPFVMVDGEGSVVLANSLFTDLICISEEDLEGRSFTALCDAETANAIRRDLRRRKTTRAHTFHGVLTRPSAPEAQTTENSNPPVRIECPLWLIPLFDDKGLRSGFLITIPAAGEKAWGSSPNGEDALRTRDFLRGKLLDVLGSELGIGVCVLNAASEVVSANTRGEQYIEAGAVGKGQKRQAGARLEERVLETGEPCREVLLHVDDAGDPRWFEVTALPLHNEYSKVTHVAKLIRDVNKQKRLEHQVLRQQHSSLVSQIAVAVAHQLRNPLGVMIGFAEMLSNVGERGGLPPDQAPAAIEKILRNGLRCKEIVEELLEFGKGAPADRTPSDVNQIMREQVQQMYPGSMASRVAWRLAPNLPPVECVPGQIAQVFANLIDNALWAANSQVVVETAALGNTVHIKVRDDGPGVPDTDRGRVFEPFFSTRQDEARIGLGLSLSRAVVQEHNGVLFLDETVTEGACFVVELPALEPVTGSNRPDQSGKTSPSVRAERARRILLVDDEIDLLDLLSTALTLRGHHIDTAATGVLALEMIRNAPYDLAVVDILLPGELGGRELYHIMLGAYPNLADRILFITADTMNYETREFLERVARPYLEKPFLVADFADTVEHLLKDAGGEQARPSRPQASKGA